MLKIASYALVITFPSSVSSANCRVLHTMGCSEVVLNVCTDVEAPVKLL